MIKENDLILGISDSHDAGICIIKGSELIYAINEERISRVKNQSGFPHKSINNFINKFKIDPSLLKNVGVAGIARISDKIPTNNDLSNNDGKYLFSVKFVSFISKFKFMRFIINSSFFIYIHKFIFGKVLLSIRKKDILQNLRKHNIYPSNIKFYDHHDCHTVSTFISSPFKESLVFSNDGMGDGICSKVSLINVHKLQILSQNSFYNSLAMIYGYASHLCDFKKNHHNGKTTGLSAHGDSIKTIHIFREIISWDSKKNYYISKKGVFLEALKYLKQSLLPFSKKDIAAGIQKITDELIVKQVSEFYKKFKINNICLVGGLHANVLTNSKIIESNQKFNVFVFPNMSDGGLSVGAAGLIFKEKNSFFNKLDLKNFYLGDEFLDVEIEEFLNSNKIKFYKNENIEFELAKLLNEEKIIARFSGKLEYGPRALGNRSILYHAKDKTVNTWLNQKLRRTETMPFAPILLSEFAEQYINNYNNKNIISAANMTITQKASDLCISNSPAAVHIDSTLRPQILDRNYNPKLHDLLKHYYNLSGIPLLINTSFNIHEQPIVRTPEEAYKSFVESELDALAIGNYLVLKND